MEPVIWLRREYFTRRSAVNEGTLHLLGSLFHVWVNNNCAIVGDKSQQHCMRWWRSSAVLFGVKLHADESMKVKFSLGRVEILILSNASIKSRVHVLNVHQRHFVQSSPSCRALSLGIVKLHPQLTLVDYYWYVDSFSSEHLMCLFCARNVPSPERSSYWPPAPMHTHETVDVWGFVHASCKAGAHAQRVPNSEYSV